MQDKSIIADIREGKRIEGWRVELLLTEIDQLHDKNEELRKISKVYLCNRCEVWSIDRAISVGPLDRCSHSAIKRIPVLELAARQEEKIDHLRKSWVRDILHYRKVYESMGGKSWMPALAQHLSEVYNREVSVEEAREIKEAM